MVSVVLNWLKYLEAQALFSQSKSVKKLEDTY